MANKSYTKAQRKSYVEGKIVGYKLAMKKRSARKSGTSKAKRPSKSR